MKQREEITGLRAFAVLPVVINHAFPNLIPGGFAGVDVFFVISGFLIGRILFEEIQTERFSLARFYDRRCRRILPMLAVVSLVSVVAGWVLLLPTDFQEFLISVGSASIFVSNIYFAQLTDYFSPDAGRLPMLHTWSLSVEEQFYLVFPLILLLIWKRATRPRTKISNVLAILVFASFALSVWGGRAFPDTNFFSSFSRAWELLAGALAGLHMSRLKKLLPSLQKSMVNGGLVVLVATYFVVDERTAFPSEWTAIPVLGTVAILVWGESPCIASRIMHQRPLITIGLISYSMYLWHQPILAFTRVIRPDYSWHHMAAGIALSGLLSFASWRWIEQPARNLEWTRTKVLRTAAFVVVSIAVISGLTSKTRPETLALWYLSPDKVQISEFMDNRLDKTDLYRRGTCFVEGSFPEPSACSWIKNTRGSIFVWGDSHGAALSVGLATKVPDFATMTMLRCPVFVMKERTTDCSKGFQQVLEEIAQSRPATLILHANWLLRESEIQSLPELISRVRTLSPSTRTVIVGGVPQWRPDLPSLLLAKPERLVAGSRQISKLNEIRRVDHKLQQVASQAGVRFIPLIDKLCLTDSACLAVVSAKNGHIEPFAFDYGHLTVAASYYLASVIMAELR